MGRSEGGILVDGKELGQTSQLRANPTCVQLGNDANESVTDTSS